MCKGEAAEESSRLEKRNQAEREAGGWNKVCVEIIIGDSVVIGMRWGVAEKAGRCFVLEELFWILGNMLFLFLA